MRLSATGGDAPRVRYQAPTPQHPEHLRRGRHKEAANSTTDISFRVKTADGDTVTLSLHQTESAAVKGRRAAYANNVDASVEVLGELSENEMQDIQRVLAAFSHGDAVTDLGTLASAAYAYKTTFSYLV